MNLAINEAMQKFNRHKNFSERVGTLSVRDNRSSDMHPIFPIELRAISVHAPIAWLICKGYKAEEYRYRPTKRRGLTLIHASGSRDSDLLIEDYSIPVEEVARKAIVGAVRIADCIPSSEGYAYILEEPILFQEAIAPVRGQQSIFWAASTPERVQAFNRAWELLNQ
jgi:hypothetical protein